MCDPTCLTHRADVLRGYGAGLQMAGILAAALGIRAVRREWTRNPGVVGTLRGAALTVAARSGAVAARLRRFIRFLVLRKTEPVHVHDADIGLVLEWSAQVKLAFSQPAQDADEKAKIEWLLRHVNQLLDITQDVSREVHEERAAREAALAAAADALEQTNRGIRESLADFAGGGLRLQVGGVIALLFGVVLATFPEWLATLVNRI